MRPGSRTSLTTGWPPAPTPRSPAGSTTTPGWPHTSSRTPGSRLRPWSPFTQATAEHGHPASTLTDNGTVYTTRFAGGRAGRNHLEHELRRLGIVQKSSRPDHPTTCGRVGRFQQTMREWLVAQPVQPVAITGLQALVDACIRAYNHDRPHRSLPHWSTPAAAYAARPRGTSAPAAPATPTTDSATTGST
ncbi:integrase core domain-containing protein [Geodermatophilus sp. SYSU D00696]